MSTGSRLATEVRSIECAEALVDTGALTLSLPKRFVTQLGLKPFKTRHARTRSGSVTVQIFGTIKLTIQGRECTCDVVEVPDDIPVLVGNLPLELLDFVVDPSGQRLIGNPAHDGEQVIELY